MSAGGAAESPTHTVSVVVCAYDERRWDDIRRALSSLESQLVKPQEVIVVVDHNERLLDRIRSEYPVTAVANTKTPGLGGARNSGVAVASGSIVAFLDDDAVASHEWLARLLEPYQDEAVAAVGGSAKPRWMAPTPSWFPPEFLWVIGCSYYGMPERREEVRNVFGCNMSFRRECLNELGGFRLGYSCDETELCIRLRQRWPEKKIVYEPAATIDHTVPEDRLRLSRFIRRCYFEGGSKAVVSRLVGTGQGLSSEYQYTRRILPRGIRRGAMDYATRRDVSGLGRAGAIVAGLLATAAGYVVGNLSFERSARKRGWTG
jgi:glycosyltransferase involved in cell wall biosynthesis